MSSLSSSSSTNANEDAFLDELTREFFDTEKNILENHPPSSSSSSSSSSADPFTASSSNNQGLSSSPSSSSSSLPLSSGAVNVDSDKVPSGPDTVSSSSSSSTSTHPSSRTSNNHDDTYTASEDHHLPPPGYQEDQQQDEDYVDPEQIPYPRSVRPLIPEKEKADGALPSSSSSSSTDNHTNDTIERNPDLSNACKEEGNRHFGKGNYELAISCYTESLRLLPRTTEYYPRFAIIYANRAASYLLLNRAEHYDDAVYDCDRALELKPDYVKALARRATALEKLTQYDEAVKDLQAWIDLEPNERKPKQELERLNNLIKERDQKLKDEMLGKLKDLGNSILGKFGLSLDNFKAVQDPSTGSYSISFQK